MKHLLPTRPVLALFAVIAVVGGAAATMGAAHEEAMALVALPVFAIAMWLGMRHSGQWASLNSPVIKPAEVEEEIAV